MFSRSYWIRYQGKRARRGWGRRWLPAVLAMSLIITTMSGLSILASRLTVWRTQAVIDDVRLEIIGPAAGAPAWLEVQMDHGEGLSMPASMTPDLPKDGFHRLSAELKITNHNGRSQTFSPSELVLLSASGGRWPGAPGNSRYRLQPDQHLYVFASFDVPEIRTEELRLAWSRNSTTAKLMVVPHPPAHDNNAIEEPKPVWPANVGELLEGNAERGKSVYSANYCWGCHGHPLSAGSHTIGPHLAGIGTAAAARKKGMTAAAYLYESMLEPNTYLAKGCKLGPCPAPSRMQSYRRLLGKKQMADVLAYLLSLR